MVTLNEARETIREVYAAMGNEPQKLVAFQERDISTLVTRDDDAKALITRADIDDFRETGDQAAKSRIEDALQFVPPDRQCD